MNVTCDKCGKAYVIADDKIVGKTSFKIRCKQCQNLVTVTVGTPTAAVPAPVAAVSAPPPPAPSPEWFAMLAGKQHGPFDLDELRRRAAGQEVTPRTYLWRAGMADWKRAQEVTEVSGLFAAPPPPPPAAFKDVAVAPEAPAPEVVKSGADSGVGAVAGGHALFGDDAERRPQVGGAAAEDPFAALGPAAEAPPASESTAFFIAKSGVKKRNPPWKVALFVVGIVGFPLLLVFLLSSFKLVELPTVTRTNEQGEQVEESFFSAGGAAGLRDLLTGEGRKKPEAAQGGRKVAGAGKAPPPEVVVPRKQDPNLAAFYEQNDLKTAGPKVRKTGEETGGAQVNTAGLSDQAVSKVVADKAKAFETCIDNALRRNPNLAVGNITMVLTVGPSGAVKSAGVEPKKHETSEWAQCMTSTARRIVFPGSDGETEVQLPFKVGVAVSP